MSGLWNRMVSRLQGEVSASTLEAYRRASVTVLELLQQCEEIRDRSKLEGKTAWTIAGNLQAQMLCAWNAFVLQSLGNEFLDADYRDDPTTVGYVPPITADQIMSFYAQVEGWLNRALQAQSNPDYRLDVGVPAALPRWSEVEPCPNSHLHGMLYAMRAVRDQAAAAMTFLGGPPEDETQLAQYNRIQQLQAAAIAKARYAEDLHGKDLSQAMHERIEPHIKESIESFYKLGQWAAMPSLASDRSSRAAPPQSGVTASRRPLPGEPGFDPWILTDPNTVDRWKRDPSAQRAVRTLWELDPNPARTLEIKDEIDAAFARGDIRLATDRYNRPLGHFFCCPWAPVYEVVRSVALGGTWLRPMETFVFDVNAEGVNLGNSFTCRIMVGAFQPTDRTEYGDPNEEPDH